MDSDRLSALPQAFLHRMKDMLGDDFEPFLAAYEQPRTYGLRVNTAKISCEEFEQIVPFEVKKIPWVSNGYFYNEDVRPSRCALYQAGLYYLQEPSAMTPASRIPVDMCAAPGGKATAVGSALKGEGLLVANDISTTRARALLRNLELFGIPNLFVSNEKPEKMVKNFPEFFHKIILDAPCSGEGMFRKEESLAKDWTPEKSEELSRIQKQLCLNAADMLQPGGQMLYSTCTFAPCEDEQIISWLLRERPELSLISMEDYEGFSTGNPEWGDGNPQLKKCVRIFPHKMQGEGHFLALLQKEGTAGPSAGTSKTSRLAADVRKYMEEFFREIGLKTLDGQEFDWNRVEVRADKVYYLPSVSYNFRGLTFIRNGLYLGDLKKNRFEPAQPLALAFRKNEAEAVISLSVDDPRLERYLKGETLTIEPEEAAHSKGWHLLCVEGYPLGFGKLVNGTLKNKYPAGWRV